MYFEYVIDNKKNKSKFECPEFLRYNSLILIVLNKRLILHYSAQNLVSTIDLQVVYENSDWYIDKGVFNNPIRMDYDSKIETCTSNINIKLKEFEEEAEKIENKIIENKENCITKFEVTRTLSEIAHFYKENLEEINERGTGINRLNSYLIHYSINSKTLEEYNNIAYYLEQSKNYKEAIFLLEKIIQQFPNRTVAYINLGDAYWGINDHEKSKKAYKEYIKQMKKSGKKKKIPKVVLERILLKTA